MKRLWIIGAIVVATDILWVGIEGPLANRRRIEVFTALLRDQVMNQIRASTLER